MGIASRFSSESAKTVGVMGDWQRDLRRGLEADDRAALARVPKTDLHCHGLLSAPFSAYQALASHPLPPPPATLGSFRAFADYISTNFLPLFNSPENVRSLIRAALDRMVADGVVYAEMSFDLLLPEFTGIRIEEFGELLAEERDRVAGRLDLAPELGIARGLPPEHIERRFKTWLSTGVCKGIDLYDDETLGVLSDIAPLYRLAKDQGLKLKAHAGELLGADVVRQSVELLDLDAVQHGVRAAEDPRVADFLAERGTVLHVCPTSNRSLGVAAKLEQHPARQLCEQGVKLTVNTDDYAVFAADVSDELLNLKRMGLDPDQIVAIVETGLAQRPSNS